METPFSQVNKQIERQSHFVYDHTLNSPSQSHVAFVMPTLRKELDKELYNLYVPDLGNMYMERVKKIEPGGDTGTNGTGKRKHPLRVGQPVTLLYLGDSQQPVIQGGIPSSGDPSPNMDLDQRTERAAYFPTPGAHHPVVRPFSGAGEFSPIMLRPSSPVQPPDAPVQVELPGNSLVETDDGYSYEFGLNTSFKLRASENFTIEGQRKSMVTNPQTNAQIQINRVIYELNRTWNKIYKIDLGTFTPGKERKGVEPPPVDQIMQQLNELLMEVEFAVQEEIDWYTETVIKPKDDIFDVIWADLFTEEEIKAPMGCYPYVGEMNILGSLNGLGDIPTSGDTFVENFFTDIYQGLVGDLGNFLYNFLDDLFEPEGGKDEKYNPYEGSIVSFRVPVTASEGDPAFLNIKYANEADIGIEAEFGVGVEGSISSGSNLGINIQVGLGGLGDLNIGLGSGGITGGLEGSIDGIDFGVGFGPDGFNMGASGEIGGTEIGVGVGPDGISGGVSGEVGGTEFNIGLGPDGISGGVSGEVDGTEFGVGVGPDGISGGVSGEVDGTEFGIGIGPDGISGGAEGSFGGADFNIGIGPGGVFGGISGSDEDIDYDLGVGPGGVEGQISAEGEDYDISAGTEGTFGNVTGDGWSLTGGVGEGVSGNIGNEDTNINVSPPQGNESIINEGITPGTNPSEEVDFNLDGSGSNNNEVSDRELEEALQNEEIRDALIADGSWGGN